MKEKIMNAFKTLGFELMNIEDLWYGFEYEGINYLWMVNDDDEFLNISIPAVIDVDSVIELEFYKLMDKFNSTLKYVKVNKFLDSMWLFYERELVGDEDLELLIPHIVIQLEYALHFIRNYGEDSTSEDNVKAGTEDLDFDIEDIEILDDND